ncbi:MAG: hypothetical protein ACTSWK_17740 [Promethearchaeota archaeon]
MSKRELSIANEIRRLSNLKNFKKKDSAWIEKQAKINVWTKQIDIENRFDDEEEKKTAVELFDNYLENYEFYNFSEFNTLASLIFEEVLERTLQKQINDINAKDNTTYIPDKIINSLHSTQDRIKELKNQLGINKKEEIKDLSAFQKLLRRLKLYIPFHRNEFTTICAKCATPLLLRRRCGEKFENLTHPMFSGRFYFNRRGIELVKKGFWTKEQYAWVFYTSPRYVEWCIEHEHDTIEIDKIPQDKVQEFIDKNPFLKDVTVPSQILENKKQR